MSGAMAAPICLTFEPRFATPTVLVGCCQDERQGGRHSTCFQITNHNETSGVRNSNDATNHCRSHQCRHGSHHGAVGDVEERDGGSEERRDGDRRRRERGFSTFGSRWTKEDKEVEVFEKKLIQVLHTVGAGWRPSSTDIDGEASNPGPRLRRRGPRSIDGVERQRRRQLEHINAHTAAVHSNGQIESTWSGSNFNLLHPNIRGWTSHVAELTATIRSMKRKPDMVCVNETFLNKAVEDVNLEGFTLVGVNLAGVTDPMADCAERFWLLVHAEQRPHLVGVWYRPPNPGEVQTVNSFKAEMQSLAD